MAETAIDLLRIVRDRAIEAVLLEGSELPTQDTQLFKRIDAVLDRAEEEKSLLDRLPKNSAGLPILPGDHLLVARTKQEIIVESIGDDNVILVGGLAGVDDDCWNEMAEDLDPIPETDHA